VLGVGASGHAPGSNHPVGQPGDSRRVQAERALPARTSALMTVRSAIRPDASMRPIP
jgi:hypothetical protein